MGFNSAFKGLKLLKTPGTGHLNNLNDPVLNALSNLEFDYLRRLLPSKKCNITREQFRLAQRIAENSECRFSDGNMTERTLSG